MQTNCPFAARWMRGFPRVFGVSPPHAAEHKSRGGMKKNAQYLFSAPGRQREEGKDTRSPAVHPTGSFSTSVLPDKTDELQVLCGSTQN